MPTRLFLQSGVVEILNLIDPDMVSSKKFSAFLSPPDHMTISLTFIVMSSFLHISLPNQPLHIFLIHLITQLRILSPPPQPYKLHPVSLLIADKMNQEVHQIYMDGKLLRTGVYTRGYQMT